MKAETLLFTTVVYKLTHGTSPKQYRHCSGEYVINFKWHFPTFLKNTTLDNVVNVNYHNILDIEHTAIIFSSL